MIAQVNVNYGLGRKSWLLAASLALLSYLVLALWLAYSPTSVTSGQAKAVGSGGVEISLGPAGREAGATSPPAAPAAKTEPVATQSEKPTPAATTLDTANPITAQAMSAIPPKQPKALNKVPASAQPVQAQPTVEPLPEMPAPKPATDNAANTSDTDTAFSSEAPDTALGAAGQGGDTATNDQGSGDNIAGGGLPGDTADYAATLLAWLEKHKDYPRAARSRRQQGTVLLYFVLDAQGYVSQQRIEQSSGFAVLDNEALKMLQRAQPLPTMPNSLHQAPLELVVPVQFFLR